MSMGDWLTRAVRSWAGREALVDLATGARYTYAQLDARARATATILASRHGVHRGDRVAILAHNRVEHVDLYFAVQKLGAILVPLNWRLAPPELAQIALDASAQVLYYTAAFEEGAKAMLAAAPATQGVLLGDSTGTTETLATAAAAAGTGTGVTAGVGATAGESAGAEDATHRDERDCAPGDPAWAEATDPLMILYTSGTTGVPKGVIITHGQVVANSLNTGLACDLVSGDSTVTYTPFFHTGAWHVLSTPLWHRGGKVVLARSFEAGAILAAMEDEGITTIFGVPTTFQSLLEHPDFAGRDLRRLRFCLCGGAPCPVSLIDAYSRRGLVFRQGFGLTEAGPNCFSLAPEDAVRKAGTVGKPIFHCDARLVDEDGREVPDGAIGELVLAGPHLSAGYFRKPEASASLIRSGWLHTGDLASRDAEGYFSIVGRKKEMYISGGENVYPAEIENLLAAHPAIREVAVVPVADARWGEVGRAVVVLRSGAKADADVILKYLDGRLARYKIPRSVVFAQELPRNASGKVLRASLVQQYARA